MNLKYILQKKFMIKKIKIVITIITLCMGLILVNTEVMAKSAKTINGITRIREKASTDSEIIELAAKGESVEILEEIEDWYKVKYGAGKNAVTGYIRKDLVEVESEGEKQGTKKEEKESKEEAKNTSEQNQEEKNEVEQDVENTESQYSKVEKKETLKINGDTELQLMPIIYSCKTGTLSANTEVIVTEVIGNWSHIEAGDKEGWIRTSKVSSDESVTQQVKVQERKVEETKSTQTETNKNANTNKKYVSTVTLNLREEANAQSKVLTQLNQDEEVTVIKVIDNTWCKVKVNGYEGYTASEYLKDKKESVTSRGADDTRKIEEDAKKKAEEEAKKKAAEAARLRAEAAAIVKKEEEDAKKKAAEQARAKAQAIKEKKESKTQKKQPTNSVASKSKGADIVAYAKKYLGCRYVYGTQGPNTFDCSGFTSYVYKHFGYSLNRTSSGQRSNGKHVDKADLQQGDIVCFSGHVGLYIGGNKFIHAANPGKGVIITSLSNSYYVKHYITARRIL